MSCLFRPRRVPFPAPAPPPSPHDALFRVLPSTLLFLTLLNPLSCAYVIAEQQQTRVIRETPRNLNRTHLKAYPCHIKLLYAIFRNPQPSTHGLPFLAGFFLLLIHASTPLSGGYVASSPYFSIQPSWYHDIYIIKNGVQIDAKTSQLTIA